MKFISLITALLCICIVVVGESPDAAFDVKYATELYHVSGKTVYPDTLVNMDMKNDWSVLGSCDGNWGNVQIIDAPERPGKKAALFSISFNRDKPEWMTVMYSLHPTLRIKDAKEVVFDVYAFDSIDFNMTLHLGHQEGQGILPATWGLCGHFKPRKWQEIRMPVYQTRSSINNIRFCINNQDVGVPYGRAVKFCITNFRLDPASNPVAEIYTEKLAVKSPVLGGFLQMSSDNQLGDNDSLKLNVEFDSQRDIPVKMELLNKDTGNVILSRNFEIKTKGTIIDLSVKNITALVNSEKADVVLRFINESTGKIISESNVLRLQFFRRAAMESKRKELLGRLGKLEEKAEELQARKINCYTPCISLNVSRRFLDKYIPDDFDRQHAYSIAMEGLDDVEKLLNKAGREIALRESGKYVETAVNDYVPGVPVVASDGCLKQNGKEILLIGPLDWGDAHDSTEIIGKLGFNSVVVETGMNAWLPVADSKNNLYFDNVKKAGLAGHILLSSHYGPSNMPKKFDNVGYSAAGVGLPYNVVLENTVELFELWYKTMFENPNIGIHDMVSFGTANEPGYGISKNSQEFEKALRVWAKERYGKIDSLNELWKTKYTSFDEISLNALLDASENKACRYDLLEFQEEMVARFLKGRKETILKYQPNALVWVKLIGDMGYELLDEQRSFDLSQNVLGCDGSGPRWNDYLKSLHPEWPIINSEWHFCHGAVAKDPDYLQQVMFEDVAHGIASGLIWQWYRFDWKSLGNGGDGSMTRIATGLDAMGRTSHKLRKHAAIMMKFANLKGGNVRIMFSKASALHDEKLYRDSFEKVYDELAANSSGVRFVIPEKIRSAEDLKGIKLLAVANADYVQADAVNSIAQWVKEGGTLWLTLPAMRKDTWGRNLQNKVDKEFMRFVSTRGEHNYGKGQIVVSETLQTLNTYLTGPFVMDAKSGQPVANKDVELRVTDDGKYMYIMNRTDKPVEIKIDGKSGKFNDIWNEKNVDLSAGIMFPRRGVMLLETE